MVMFLAVYPVLILNTVTAYILNIFAFTCASKRNRDGIRIRQRSGVYRPAYGRRRRFQSAANNIPFLGQQQIAKRVRRKWCVAMPLSAVETIRVWLLSALVVHGAVAGNPDAKRLYDDLLSNYNKLVRPVVNTSDVLRVCIKLKLSQLIDVVSFI